MKHLGVRTTTKIKHEPDIFMDTRKHFSWQMEMDIGNWQIPLSFILYFIFISDI